MSQSQPTSPALDLKNIQGDILSGLPKKTETYVFFQITLVDAFRRQLQHLLPLIKSTADVVQDRGAIERSKRSTPAGQKPKLLTLTGVNISFSRFGLDKLGFTDADNLNDDAFKKGQFSDAATLGDPDSGADWEPAFKDKLDAMIHVAGDSHVSVDVVLVEVRAILGLTIHEVTHIVGDVRPGDQDGHEHFGFLDGISNPSIEGFDPVIPGPHQIKPGFLLLGEDGDSRATGRPEWSVDGSFLVFRYLFQRVPEFDDFLEKNPVIAPNLPPKDGSELRGARLVGRWKSGAPIDLAPLQDDPVLAQDVNRRNDFSYEGQLTDQSRCPFAAHVRKTFPRDDLEKLTPTSPSIDNRRIMRRGIQFGPEVTEDEHNSHTTKHGRGLLFVCYSSSITDGFQFIQQSWTNDPSFPPGAAQAVPPVEPGFDAIIGQAEEGTIRSLSGTDPNNLDQDLQLPATGFVVPHGGEYFFTPSISALKNKFALAA
ncbi:Dyp-type peroxidase [Hymenopellis radicata]|nr:Dyp-type peroxidase [Hymenopellis radicata]